MSISSRKKNNKKEAGGFFQNPFFYFGLTSLVLFGLLFSNVDSLAQLSVLKGGGMMALGQSQSVEKSADNADVFSNKDQMATAETPDLKIIQDNFVYGISTPLVLSTQTLGDMFGDPAQARKDVTDYVVQPGDTIESVAQSFGISVNTLIWANNLSKNVALKTGQSLVILPVSGVIHVVKAGDTLSDIAKKYKSKVDDIISFNNLAGEGDIFIGDIIIIPGGVMPPKATPFAVNSNLADSFFIYPAEGIITQGLHYFNAVDLANKCGTPIYAAAAGTVQRAIGNGGWNLGMGNYITILHINSIVTYYGHLLSLFVKPGDQVNVGDRIGLMGRTGEATGCHVHFEVIGAANPLARFSMGAVLQYK